MPRKGKEANTSKRKVLVPADLVDVVAASFPEVSSSVAALDVDAEQGRHSPAARSRNAEEGEERCRPEAGVLEVGVSDSGEQAPGDDAAAAEEADDHPGATTARSEGKDKLSDPSHGIKVGSSSGSGEGSGGAKASMDGTVVESTSAQQALEANADESGTEEAQSQEEGEKGNQGAGMQSQQREQKTSAPGKGKQQKPWKPWPVPEGPHGVSLLGGDATWHGYELDLHSLQHAALEQAYEDPQPQEPAQDTSRPRIVVPPDESTGPMVFIHEADASEMYPPTTHFRQRTFEPSFPRSALYDQSTAILVGAAPIAARDGLLDEVEPSSARGSRQHDGADLGGVHEDLMDEFETEVRAFVASLVVPEGRLAKALVRRYQG